MGEPESAQGGGFELHEFESGDGSESGLGCGVDNDGSGFGGGGEAAGSVDGGAEDVAELGDDGAGGYTDAELGHAGHVVECVDEVEADGAGCGGSVAGEEDFVADGFDDFSAVDGDDVGGECFEFSYEGRDFALVHVCDGGGESDEVGEADGSGVGG